MRGTLRSALLALMALMALAAMTDAKSDVVELTTANFDELVGGGEPWLIEFYAPWCGHCRSLAPIYETVATKLKGSVKVAKVDGTAHPGVLARFPVQGFPTIFSVRGGQVRQFTGRSRNEAAIAAFAQSDEGEALSYFSSPFGPVGRVKGALIGIGTSALAFEKTLEQSYGLSYGQAWGALVAAGLAMTVLLAGLLIFLFPAAPVGPPERRPHAD